MAIIQSIDNKAVFVFVGDVNAHHYEWFVSVSPTDCHGLDIDGKKLNLVMTDAPVIVDVFVGHGS